ncbi:MAG: FmdB family zinc ribbon protein [Acidiferrobacterales bacterium]
MPFYEYQCQACSHKFEKLQKISDDVLKDCPSCSKPELKKLISAAAFQLKGSGWYATDFKDNGKKKSEPNKNAKSSSSPGCSDGACDHKH